MTYYFKEKWGEIDNWGLIDLAKKKKFKEEKEKRKKEKICQWIACLLTMIVSGFIKKTDDNLNIFKYEKGEK